MLSAKRLTKDYSKDPFFVIVASVIVGSILVVYPLAYQFAGWRPMIMFMITVFWVLCQPTWCGVWFAFAVGLFTDLLLDAPLGLNALSYVIITFITRYFTRERRIMTFGNTWVIASLALFAHLLYILMAQAMMGVEFSMTRHWQPLLSSILLWPVLYYCLKRWRV